MTLPQPPPVDLTNCDREPIHIPGTIQPHGAMLVCDPDDGTVIHASANAAAFMGRPGYVLVGRSLGQAIGEAAAHALRNAAAKVGGSHVAGVVPAQPLPEVEDLFNITIHYNAGHLFV